MATTTAASAQRRQNPGCHEDRGGDCDQATELEDEDVLHEAGRRAPAPPDEQLDSEDGDHDRGERPAKGRRKELPGQGVDVGVVDVDGSRLAEDAQL